jgi:hypothetical protein
VSKFSKNSNNQMPMVAQDSKYTIGQIVKKKEKVMVLINTYPAKIVNWK